MQTPLPETLDLNNIPDQDTLTLAMFNTINQLIDYLKEREDEPSTETGGRGGTGYQIAAESTPSLKETLLGGMVAKARYFPGEREDYVALSDLEAVISRLMP